MMKQKISETESFLVFLHERDHLEAQIRDLKNKMMEKQRQYDQHLREVETDYHKEQNNFERTSYLFIGKTLSAGFAYVSRR